MKHFYRLNIDTNCFTKQFNLDNFIKKIRTPKFNVPTVHNFPLEKDNGVISNDWLDYMHDIQLPPKNLIMFYRQENYQHFGAHIDLDNTTGKNDRIFALNWTIDPNDQSEMAWYELPYDWEDKVVYTEIGSAYAEWPINDLKETGNRCTIADHPTLVRTDLPHTVFMKNNYRLSLSFRFDLKFDNWNDVVEYFKPYFI